MHGPTYKEIMRGLKDGREISRSINLYYISNHIHITIYENVIAAASGSNQLAGSRTSISE